MVFGVSIAERTEVNLGTTKQIRLYSFFNSSASFRVRIALNLKAIDHEVVPIDIRAGTQHDTQFLADVAPSPLVPVLACGELRISQSMAIIDWLDRSFPEIQLIPQHPEQRAMILAFANIIACDTHPLNNLRVLRYLEGELHLDASVRQRWYQHWIDLGLQAAERMLAKFGSSGSFCFGDVPSLADCCLVPQIANGLRMNCNLDAYPCAMRAYNHAMTLPAFRNAAPSAQPDFIPA